MQTQKRKRYQKDAAPTDDILTLISLVRQNPTLYNYKLQPNQRRRSDVLNGWAQIASQIGNKYTVEECRRKWKNLRDTYHQYRLRKPRLGDGLSKWRYAAELEFLSTVYQPKLKSQRNNHFGSNNNNSNTHNLLETVNTTGIQDDDGQVVEDQHVNEIVTHHHQSHHHHHSNIMVNDDAETFILATYEDGVNDDDPTSMTHMELTHAHSNGDDDDVDGVEDVEEIVKHEPNSSIDGDGATCTEVDYEECLYEESTAATAPSVDCETIVANGTNGSGNAGNGVQQDQNFHYITATNDFCLGTITSGNGNGSNTGIMVSTGTSNNNVNGNSNGNGSIKLKGVTVLGSNASIAALSAPVAVNAPSSSVAGNASANGTSMLTLHQPHQQQHITTSATTTTSSAFALSAPMITAARDELDLFFDFLKKKIQHFSKEEITGIQMEFLNCVSRHEADQAQQRLHHNNAQHSVL